MYASTQQVCAGWLRAALIAAAGFAFLTEPAVATLLNYNEAVSGDLPEDPPYPVLPLGVGVNTVTGTSDFDAPSPGSISADFDDFEFTVPVGTQLVSFGFTSDVTSVSGSPTWMRIETFIDTGDGSTALACEENWVINEPAFSSACLVPPSAPNGTFATAMPLEAGTYLLAMGQFAASNYSVTDFSYTWTLTVDPIPEPSTWAMMLLGFAGLGFVGYRTRKAVSNRRLIAGNRDVGWAAAEAAFLFHMQATIDDDRGLDHSGSLPGHPGDAAGPRRFSAPAARRRGGYRNVSRSRLCRRPPTRPLPRPCLGASALSRSARRTATISSGSTRRW